MLTGFSKLAKALLLIGILVLLLGLSGIVASLVPESRTITLTTGDREEGKTYVRLEGRYFGNFSGDFEWLDDRSSDSPHTYRSFSIWTQENWEASRDGALYEDNWNASDFSFDLPRSDAYYITVLKGYWAPDGFSRVDGASATIHYHISGARIDLVHYGIILALAGGLIVTVTLSFWYSRRINRAP